MHACLEQQSNYILHGYLNSPAFFKNHKSYYASNIIAGLLSWVKAGIPQLLSLPATSNLPSLPAIVWSCKQAKYYGYFTIIYAWLIYIHGYSLSCSCEREQVTMNVHGNVALGFRRSQWAIHTLFLTGDS